MRQPKKAKAPVFAPGVHVAPFLSREHRLVLVAIDYGSVFAGMTSVSDVSGGWVEESALNDGGTVWPFNGARSFLPHDGAPSVAQHADMLPRGVHRAPWYRAPHRPEWLAIDADGCLVASLALPHMSSGDSDARKAVVRGIVRDLRALVSDE